MRSFRWSDAPDVMGVKDVMRALGASDRTVRRLFESGDVRAVKVGGKWKCAKENLMAFVRGETDGNGKGDAA